MGASAVHVVRRGCEQGQLELVSRGPHPALRPYVRDYTGYVQHVTGVLRRRELPSGDIILIVNLGAELRVSHPRGAPRSFRCGGGFVAGLHDTYALTEAVDVQRGVEVRLTPIGAYLVLGLPMHLVANRVVALDELFDPAGRDLVGRLQDASSWEACFDLLDAAIGARVAAARAPSVGVARAWQRLLDTGGRLEIGALADELGWSRKHLIAQFREQIGLPPKTVARIVRFSRAVRLSDAAVAADAVRWADVAYEAGYYDQSHLIRDFRQFAGTTPGDFTRRRFADATDTLTEPSS